jgi:hypothetical protein
MTTEETEVIRLVVEALSGPRDRFRRIAGCTVASERLRKLLIGMRAPNGGLDTVDQCRMVLEGLVGDEIRSLHS